MPKGKDNDKVKKALVTERGLRDNPHLETITNNLLRNFKSNRMSKANMNLSLREHRTAMIPNKRDIYAYRKDANGENAQVRLLFRAGWYLSVEEAAMVEAILADGDNKKLNEQIYAQMEEQGIPVEKESGVAHDVKIVNPTV